MAHEHDAAYKMLFCFPEVVHHLLVGFVPGEALRDVDFSTLEKMPSHFVSRHLRQRAGDVIWRVKAAGEWFYIYVLIEFQSTIDPFMAVRMSLCIDLLYDELIRRKEISPRQLLPAVLPIVLYNGSSKWSAVLELADLIEPVTGELAKFVPRQQHLVIDMGRYDRSVLNDMQNLVACVMHLERPESKREMGAVVQKLVGLLGDNLELRRTFATWITALFARRSRNAIVLDEIQDLEELAMTLIERLDQWADEARQEGCHEGLKRGGAIALQKILTRRFGPLSAEVADRISVASVEQIDGWLDRVVDARSVEDVLRD